jgi:proteasome accessory factor B
LAVGFADLRTMAEEVVRYGADAVVLDPPELRERVLRMLTAVADTADRVPDTDDERVPA